MLDAAGPNGSVATCQVCDNTLYTRWTDVHGIAECAYCGSPYRLIHYRYEDEGHAIRMDEPPRLLLKPELVTPAREFWKMEQANMGLSNDFYMGRKAFMGARLAFEDFVRFQYPHVTQEPDA